MVDAERGLNLRETCERSSFSKLFNHDVPEMGVLCVNSRRKKVNSESSIRLRTLIKGGEPSIAFVGVLAAETRSIDS
jgi:hypothetical protein